MSAERYTLCLSPEIFSAAFSFRKISLPSYFCPHPSAIDLPDQDHTLIPKTVIDGPDLSHVVTENICRVICSTQTFLKMKNHLYVF